MVAMIMMMVAVMIADVVRVSKHGLGNQTGDDLTVFLVEEAEVDELVSQKNRGFILGNLRGQMAAGVVVELEEEAQTPSVAPVCRLHVG